MQRKSVLHVMVENHEKCGRDQQLKQKQIKARSFDHDLDAFLRTPFSSRKGSRIEICSVPQMVQGKSCDTGKVSLKKHATRCVPILFRKVCKRYFALAALLKKTCSDLFAHLLAEGMCVKGDKDSCMSKWRLKKLALHRASDGGCIDFKGTSGVTALLDHPCWWFAALINSGTDVLHCL